MYREISICSAIILAASASAAAVAKPVAPQRCETLLITDGGSDEVTSRTRFLTKCEGSAATTTQISFDRRAPVEASSASRGKQPREADR